MITTANLIYFAIGLPIVIYVLNCLAAREYKKVNLKTALLYISSVAMMGVFGEIFVGSIYTAITGHHLWDYTVYPVQGGFTSKYAPVIWGSYGWYLYLSHDTLRKHGITATKHLALIFAVETVFLEALCNGTFKLLFGDYLFYYLPSDLWHLTSVQAMPFYLIAGYAIAEMFKKYQHAMRLNIIVNCYLVFILLFLVH